MGCDDVWHRSLDREPAFPRSLQKHCGFTVEALMPAASALTALQARAPNSSLPAVFKKYSLVCPLPSSLSCDILLSRTNLVWLILIV